MATFIPTSNSRVGKTGYSGFTPTKNAGYKQSTLFGWQQQNKAALDILNRYNEIIKSGGWMSTDDRASYKAALDSYTYSSKALRNASEFYGATYTPEERNSWKNFFSQMNNDYNSMNDFYNQFGDETSYGYYAKKWSNDFEENSKYVSTRYGDPHLNIWTGTYDDTGFSDIEYDYINKNTVASDIKLTNDVVYGSTAAGTDNTERLQMTDDEIKIFNYIYKTEGKDKAYEYVSYLESDLNARQRQATQEAWAKYAEEKPFEASAFSILTSPIKGISYIGQTADFIDDGKIDQNAGYNKYSHINSAIRNQVTQDIAATKWGEIGSFAYQTGMSMGDFLFNTAITGGNQALSLALMGTSAAADTTIAAKDRGLEDWQAFTLGTVAGAAEIVTEKIGLDALFDTALLGKNALGYVIKNALAEGGEEVGSSVINLLTDTIVSRDKSYWNTAINGYMSRGADEKTAFWRAVGDQALSLGADFLGGAISGGVMGGVGVGIHSAGVAIEGSKIKNGSISNPSLLTDVALSYDPSNIYAQKMQDKVAKGGELSNYQVGKLAGQIQSGMIEQDTSKIKSAAESRLAELGETGDISAIADALIKQVKGEELSRADRKVLDKSKALEERSNGKIVRTSTVAERVANELKRENILSGQYSSAWAEGIGTKRVNADVYNRRESNNTPARENTTGATSSTTSSPPSPRERKSAANVLVRNAEGKAVKAEIQGVEVEGDKATFTLSNGEKVSEDKVTFRTEREELVAKLATTKVSRVQGFSTEAATAMIKGYDGNISPTQYDKVFTEAFKAGKEGASTSKVRQIASQNNVSEPVVFAAYDIGREFAKNDNSVLQSTKNNDIINYTEATNESRQSIPVREGSKWLAGANPEGQISRMEGSTGQIESRSESGRYADGEVAGIVNKGREVRVSDLGILGGSEYQKVRILDNVEETADMKAGREYAEARGLKVRYYAGDALTIESKRGTIDKVNGYILGNNIIVRATSPDFTSKQLVRHEVGHDMIAKGEVNIDKVRARVKEIFKSDEEVDQVAKYYEEAYADSGLNEEEIWEEVICDSLGDMNIFAKSNNWAEAAKHVGMTIPAIQQAVAETKVEGTQQTRGSPNSTAMYNTRDGSNGWGSVYGTAQEALNDAIARVDSKLSSAFTDEISTEKEHYAISDAIIAVQEDVRQDTITPIQGAKLLSEVYQRGGAEALDRLYNHETGNLHPKALERAKQYSTSADEAMEGKASRETLNEGEQYGNEDQNPRVLAHGQKIASVGRSENNQRKQGDDSGNPPAQMADNGAVSGRHEGKFGHNGKTESWLAANRFVSQESINRFRQALLRDRAELNSTDINGKTVPRDILNAFKDTIFTDENGSLLVLYHWTPNKFLVFAKGDTGFHFGVYQAANDRRESKTEADRGADIVKAVYLNIKNPILLNDNFEWDALEISDQLLEKGLITLEQKSKITRMEGASYGAYDSPASAYVRKLLDDLGYDGILYANKVEGKGTLSAMALYPDQIYTVSEESVGQKGKASRELDIDSEGNELSPAVAKRFANSKVVDENGRLKVVYHGTVSGEFDIFDKSKGSVEGDFGSGFYFTDKETDVEKNYEFGGPDFDNKVWRRAEQIWDEDPDIDMEDAREQAKKELYKESHRFEVYLNIENPAIVGETILFDNDSYLSEYNEEDYDNYDDYIGDVDQLVTDDIDNIIWDIERNVDLYSNTDSIRNALYEAYYEGGVSIEKFKERINELYLESNNGDVVSNEVTRQIIESLGYDGIIDPTVATKFKNMGMEADTTHYIVFKPNQIKDVGNKNPTDNPNIHYSRELDLIDYINEQVGEESDPNLTKTQQVARVRGELENMHIGKAEIMSIIKLADEMYDTWYSGVSTKSDFRYALAEATKLAFENKEGSFDKAYELIFEIAREMAYNPKQLSGDAQLLVDIKNHIRGTTMSVHEADKTSGEFDKYGGYNEFRKKHFGKFTLANSGLNVDTLYSELQEVYGEAFFPEVNTISEQLLQMAQVMDTPVSDFLDKSDAELQSDTGYLVNSLFKDLGDIWSKAMQNGAALDSQSKNKNLSNRELLANALETTIKNEAEQEKITEYKSKIDELNKQSLKAFELRKEIKEISFSKGKRDSEKLKSLKEELRKTENRINYYDRKLLQLESTKALKDVVERARSDAYKKAAEKGRENLHRNIEGRNKTAERHAIKALKDKFVKMMDHPTDRQYIPANLISAMVDVCQMIDTDTDLYKADGSINKAQQKRNEQMERLLKLRDEYAALGKNPDPMYSGEFDQDILDYLDELRQDYTGKSLNEMTLVELKEFRHILRAIDETLQDARKLIGWGETDSVYDAGDRIISDQRAITEKRKGKGEKTAVSMVIDNSISPLRNVKRMADYKADSPLVKSFRDLELGVRKKNKFAMDAYKSFETLTSGENAKKFEDAIYKPFGKEYVDKEGRKFHVSKMQMMQAIMSYNRELANDKLKHVSEGGFTFADLDLLNKGNLKEAIDPKNAHSVSFGAALATKFQSELASDSWAQEYMKTAEQFFDGTAKDAINEANMTLKHRIIATGSKYIPYEVNKDFVVREITSENDIQQTISGYGMMKDLKDGATQPLIITGLNNILERHIDQVSNIHGLAVPVRNFNKVWNVKAQDGSTTVQEAIKRNFGDRGAKVMIQAVKDVQGSRIKPEWERVYSAIKGNVIGATFMGNGSVVTKQVGSLFTATAKMKWRDPVSMIGNLLYTMANYKKISAEVDKYTASAWMRRQGMSDAELHSLTTEAKKKGVVRLVSKLPTAINPTKWISGMDSMVALSLWTYAKADVAKQTGLSGEDLNKAAAEYYDDIIENTQSMSDALHRPEIQKSGGVISEALGTFKTDLYQGAGLMADALGEYRANPTKENANALAKAVTGNVMSAVWGSIMTTAFALLRYKVNRYRDDEDDEIDAESWLKVQGSDLAGDLVGYIVPLFGGEVYDIVSAVIKGEQIESFDNMVLETINDFVNACVGVGNAVRQGDWANETAYKKLINSIGSIFGVPISNMTRLWEAINLHAQDIANGELGSFEAGLTSPNALRLYNAYIEGNADKIKKASRLYKDQKDIDSALRKQLRENDPRMKEAANAYIAGDYAKYNALRAEIVSEGIFSNTLVTDALKAEINYIKNKDKESE